MKYQVKIRKVFDTEKPVKALASVTIENKIAIHGVRIVETEKGRFVAMPFSTSKDKDGNEIRRDVRLCRLFFGYLSVSTVVRT